MDIKMLEGNENRISLLYTTPSPLQHLPRISHDLGFGQQQPLSIWAKRDDQCSPIANAGNKIRKLEYVLHDILYSSSSGTEFPITTLVTEGGIQSNHCVQVAAAAARLGLDAVVLLHDDVGRDPSLITKDDFCSRGNVQIMKLLGAEIQIVKGPGSEKHVLDELRNNGKNPAWIPSGASSHPAGGLGYARWILEVVKQERSLQDVLTGSRVFDFIFVACQSGSTLAGMVAGAKYLQKHDPSFCPRNLVGIFASPSSVEDQISLVLRLAQSTAVRLGLEASDISASDFTIDGRFSCNEYGVTDASTRENMAYIARTEGIVTDPVYTGKTISAVCQMAKDSELITSSGDCVNVLFVHTGGHTSVSAYPGFEEVSK